MSTTTSRAAVVSVPVSTFHAAGDLVPLLTQFATDLETTETESALRARFNETAKAILNLASIGVRAKGRTVDVNQLRNVNTDAIVSNTQVFASIFGETASVRRTVKLLADIQLDFFELKLV